MDVCLYTISVSQQDVKIKLCFVLICLVFSEPSECRHVFQCVTEKKFSRHIEALWHATLFETAPKLILCYFVGNSNSRENSYPCLCQ